MYLFFVVEPVAVLANLFLNLIYYVFFTHFIFQSMILYEKYMFFLHIKYIAAD